MLLRKAVYPSEYNDEWKKVNKTSLTEKEDLHTYKTFFKLFNVKPRHISRFASYKGYIIVSWCIQKPLKYVS